MTLLSRTARFKDNIMTVKEAITSLKATRQGADVTDAQLIEWLSSMEGYIANEILSHYPDAPEYEPFNIDTDGVMNKELLVEEPYSILYTYRLQAMVDYVNADMAQYTSSMVAYNNEYKTWMDNYNRQHTAKFVGVRVF